MSRLPETKFADFIKKTIQWYLEHAGTIQKTVYYVNLTRAALNDCISRDKYFKLCKCIKNLTEEDLLFLIEDVQKTGTSTIREDRDNIDDFRAEGLLREVDEGFSYTRRAFELLKFGLLYEKNMPIPDDIQERMTIGSVKDEDISKIVRVEGKKIVVGTQ